MLPFTVSARHLFQDIWREGVDWDEEIPMEMKRKFKMWLDDLQELKNVHISRKLLDENGQNVKKT